MFALGCIQSLTCNTNTCPTGVATQDPMRQRALVVEDKAQRVFNFHRNTLRALSEMIAAAGLEHPSQVRPHHLVRRVGHSEVRLFSQLHVFLEPGELLEDNAIATSTATLGSWLARIPSICRVHSPTDFRELSALFE